MPVPPWSGGPDRPGPHRGPSTQEVSRVLKQLALAAAVAGAVTAVRKRRSGGQGEADLWHEATRGPQAVSTPPTR